MVERRAGGETGIRAVELLMKYAVWRWRDSEEGLWSKPLLEAALERLPARRQGQLEELVRIPRCL